MSRRSRSLPKARRLEVFEVWGGRCAYCGGPADHLDHVVPSSRGGRHGRDNRLPACRSCGHDKDSLTLAEWLVVVAARGTAPVPSRTVPDRRDGVPASGDEPAVEAA